MRKITTYIMVFICAISLVSLQGCSMDKPFVKKDVASFSPLKAFRYETQEIRKDFNPTVGAYGGILGGFQAGLEAGRAASAGRNIREKCALPDFGQLVMNKFIEMIAKEIPNWPEMIVEDKPVKNDYVYESRYSLAFIVKAVDIYDGFYATTTIQMKGPDNNLLFRRTFIYRPSEFSRKRDFYDCKILKEDMEFASDKTVSDFIEHLKGGK